MGLVDNLRRFLSTNDERGRKTSDIFRLLVRRSTRTLIGEDSSAILDAGGGDGLLFDPGTGDHGDGITILDLDIPALRDAHYRYEGRGAFIGGDMTAMPFKDGTFDASVCIGTFYNFPNVGLIEKGLSELSRVTGKHGKVIVEFRNAGNPIVSLAYRHAEKYDKSLNGLNVKAYRYAQVKEMLRKAGLEIVRVKSIGLPLRPLIFSFIFECRHISTHPRLFEAPPLSQAKEGK